MFVVVESGGFQSPYVPGRFRQRQVDPIQKIDPADRVGRESRQSYLARDHSYHGSSRFIQAYEAVETTEPTGRSPILAKTVMSSPVVSLPSDATFQQAQDLFRSRRFRHVPVINAQRQILGIVSDRDMLRGEANPSAYQLPSAFDPTQTAVLHFMSQPVLVANPQTEVRGIARVMFEEHVGAMPIVSDAGVLMGMITRSDILRVLISHPDFDRWV